MPKFLVNQAAHLGLARSLLPKNNHQNQHDVNQRNKVHLIHAVIVMITQLKKPSDPPLLYNLR